MRRILILTVTLFIFMLGASLKAQDEPELRGEDKLITLDVKDMEITDVIRMIADQSGLNIVTSKNVHGKISIDLEGVRVEDALDAILKVNNCAYIKEGNIIQVYTLAELQQQEQFLRLITRVFTLRYVRAADIKPMLISLKSEKGKVEADPKSNRIVVTDTKENIKSIEEAIKAMDKELETKVYRLSYARALELQKELLQVLPEAEGEVLVDARTNSLIITASPLLLNKMDVLVRNWDRQIPQVLIEAKIMQVTLEDQKVLGFNWQFKPTRSHSITIGGGDLPLPATATYVDAFKVGVLSSDDYQVTLRALQTLSDANLISSPRVVTIDNEEAKILIGSSEPYEVLHYDSEGRLTTTELKFIEVGIKLFVTPKIAEDGYVTMNIHPEVSSPRAGTVTTDALAIDTTEATTVMTVKDGNTVVLGGLIKDDVEEYVAKVPILGDIPIIKHLFRNTRSKKVKREIIIFITPRILMGRNEDLEADKEVSSIEREKAMRDVMYETLQKEMR